MTGVQTCALPIWIQGRIGRRLVCFSALLLIFWTGYGIVVFTGIKNNYITGVLTANLIVFAAVFGNWLASPLKRPAELVPLCLVVALSDIFSVFAGPTKQFAGTISQYYEGGMEGIPPLVDFILVKMPLPGQRSEERRVGEECRIGFRARGSPDQ